MASDRGSQNGEGARSDNYSEQGPASEPLGDEAAGSNTGSGRSRWWLLLLLLPYVGLLYPALYDSLRPWVFGFPFFLWYQFLWVFIGVAITFFVYKVSD